MNASETRETIVGGLVIAVFALALILSHGGQATRTSADGYLLNASFNKVDGLVLGDEVRLGGVNIGKVESMALDPNFRARLGLRIVSDAPLPLDTSAAIHTNGLFGSKHIVLEPGAEEEVLKDGGTIEFTQESVVVSDLLELIISEGKARQAAQKQDKKAE